MKEKPLSAIIGLSREVLKEFRSSYEEGVDWVRIESRKPKHLWSVEWTEEGIRKLKANIGIKEEEKLEPPQQVTGTVCEIFLNPRVIGVIVDGQKTRAICRDSSNFKVGAKAYLKWDCNRWTCYRHPGPRGVY